jgi:hypothetical protein
VVDKRGKVYKERSFINADVFLQEKELMKSAYYSKKIPKYWEEIKSGQRILTSFYNIKKTLLEDVKEFEVEEIYAHNMRFDYGSLNNTQRWLSNLIFAFSYSTNLFVQIVLLLPPLFIHSISIYGAPLKCPPRSV